MQKNNRELKVYVKITAIVILMSFLKMPMYAEQPTMPQPTLSEGVMNYYSDSEIDWLINEISSIVIESIDQAAAEAARATALASIEREAATLREAERWRREAEANLQTIRQIRRVGLKNALITGLACFAGGLVLGLVIR